MYNSLFELFSSIVPENCFADLKGKTLVSLVKRDGDDGEEILITTDRGEQYRLYHQQDCCESVYVESIDGDIEDVLNSPIVVAEENSNHETVENEYQNDSITWTFYKLDTIKGGITIRWVGSSNGYYSESVYFKRIK